MGEAAISASGETGKALDPPRASAAGDLGTR